MLWDEFPSAKVAATPMKSLDYFAHGLPKWRKTLLLLDMSLTALVRSPYSDEIRLDRPL